MNKEGLKEKIGWYRHLFTFLAAINFACVGWFIANLSNPFEIIFYLNVFAIIVSFIGILILIRNIKRHIKTLGEK